MQILYSKMQDRVWGIVTNDENYGVVVIITEQQQQNGESVGVPGHPIRFIKHKDTVIFDSDVEVAPEIIKAILDK